MHVTMVKKLLASGEPCRKCAQAEDMLKNRGLWERIDEVVWADENDDQSIGAQLARQHGVDLAPFFIVRTDAGKETVYTSAIKFMKEGLADAPKATSARGGFDLDSIPRLAREQEGQQPEQILSRALAAFGAECVISFSGAEDVVLIDMAAKSTLPFSVLSLDTGRLPSETYRFLDRVRSHYGIEIQIVSPDPKDLEPFVRKKGLFSFYDDGHHECCEIRKVKPLGRALLGYSSWVTGQRKDQSVTRTALATVALDTAFSGKSGPLVKWNPLSNWSSERVWRYIRDNDVPYNELHKRGFVSIGCEPCTRATEPDEHERAGRWWWEAETQRECGLHLARTSRLKG
jgi:phosphoadenosine phosphosulfate reductase